MLVIAPSCQVAGHRMNRTTSEDGYDVWFTDEKIYPQDCPKFFQTVRTFSTLSGNFPHCLEVFQTGWKFFRLWKLSRLQGNFPDSMYTFQTLWIPSRFSRNIPDCQDRNLSIPPGNFPVCEKFFQTIWYILKPNHSRALFIKLFGHTKTFRPTRRRGFKDSDIHLLCSDKLNSLSSLCWRGPGSHPSLRV